MSLPVIFHFKHLKILLSTIAFLNTKNISIFVVKFCRTVQLCGSNSFSFCHYRIELQKHVSLLFFRMESSKYAYDNEEGSVVSL